MKQLLQHLNTGDIELIETPVPSVKSGHLLIQTKATLVSSGTERMLMQFGKANVIGKVRQQPEKVREVLEKVQTDGLIPTIEAVRAKLNQPIPLGYCNAGVVVEAGPDVRHFSVGDRVVSNAPHAEFVLAPVNLCARIPEVVTDESAAFTVIGAVALQSVRLLNPTIGECFAVTGLGLVGLLAVQFLQAAGCRVIGIDVNEDRMALARSLGADTISLSGTDDPVASARHLTEDRGVDGVLIAASTPSDAPVQQAAQMCRQRGRIVLVGVTGLHLSRDEFYKKELTFQVSCSYGPGRYDPAYEIKGHDYPFGLVRWTARRNFEAVLDMMSRKTLDTQALITHRFSFEQAPEAYQILNAGSGGIGLILNYPSTETNPSSRQAARTISISDRSPTGQPCLGFIGAGNYATRVLIPAFQKTGAAFRMIASAQGVSGTLAARKYNIQETTTDTDRLFQDPAINVVVIATRHDSHADFVCKALLAGKHVFVEKPLAITPEQLMKIQTTYELCIQRGDTPTVMVGFNRRFAPQTQKIKRLLAATLAPRSIIITVNAGALPADHWQHDPQAGGGRIIGEACHFVDVLRYLIDQPVVHIQKNHMGLASKQGHTQDTVSVTLLFKDGSTGTIHCFSNGHKSFPKERIEIFCDGRILQLDNFRRLTGFGWPGFRKMHLWRQDKGHQETVNRFIASIRRNTEPPIPFHELLEVTQATFEISHSDHASPPGQAPPSE